MIEKNDATRETIVLASGSASRRAMLEAAGIAHDVMPVDLDEGAIKTAMADAPPREVAVALALAKARAGAQKAPGRVVLGGDSIVSLGGRRFGKPADRREAEAHLRAFAGETIELHSAAALVRDDDILGEIADSARLSVRPLSDAFIAAYLDAEWPAIAACAGCFRIEARGVQLFAQIDGDHFTILGMPLIGLLNDLRRLGLLAS